MEKKIEFLKSKKEYMDNCVQHIIWGMEKIKANPRSNGEIEMRQSLTVLQSHVNEIRHIVEEVESSQRKEL